MTADTRQQLYDRIRETSRDEVILEEMIRHGFWPADDGRPSLPEELIRRRGELQREISALAAKARAYDDQERAIKEIMKERMRIAREKRIETKKRQAQARYDKAVAWYEKRTRDIVHLGDAASPALKNREGNEERLKKNGLPVFAGFSAIADAMGISVGELRFLTYDRKVAKVAHYKRFSIPKKTGGLRTVSAPMPRLKRAQYWLLENILAKLEPHEAAHGFRPGRSILTNAAPHTNKAVVINLDLKDFFPGIGYKRVKGLFASFGYSEAEAAIFALLGTEADRSALQLDGEVWHIADSARALPQGAPTSPAITNLLCRKLDRRLAGAARKYGFAYTRYADDLTFSAATYDKPALDRLMKTIRFVVREEGFTVNEDKTRVMRKGRRQEVTGLTVNDGISVSRKERRKFRAYLHRAKSNPPTKAFRRGTPKSSAIGFAQFLTMVLGESARSLSNKAHEVFADAHEARKEAPGRLTKAAFRLASAQGRPAREEWWSPRPLSAPETPLELVEPPEPRVKPAASSSVPPSGDTVRQERDRLRTRTQPGRQNEHPLNPTWHRWMHKRRIPLTLFMLFLFLAVPQTLILFVFAIYFMWFRKPR